MLSVGLLALIWFFFSRKFSNYIFIETTFGFFFFREIACSSSFLLLLKGDKKENQKKREGTKTSKNLRCETHFCFDKKTKKQKIVKNNVDYANSHMSLL